MNPIARDVFDALAAMGIEFTYLRHDPVTTIEDCAAPAEALDAIIPRNLFLTHANSGIYYLLLASPDAAFRTSSVSKQLGVARLSFAPPEKPIDMLRALPGAITPMGLIFESAKDVRLAVDSKLKGARRLAFHPCVNDMSLAMAAKDFFGAFLHAVGATPEFVEM